MPDNALSISHIKLREMILEGSIHSKYYNLAFCRQYFLHYL